MKDLTYIILTAFLLIVLVFMAGYTLGEEKTEEKCEKRISDRLKKQIKDMGICHIDRAPYRCEPITR